MKFIKQGLFAALVTSLIALTPLQAGSCGGGYQDCCRAPKINKCWFVAGVAILATLIVVLQNNIDGHAHVESTSSGGGTVLE